MATVKKRTTPAGVVRYDVRYWMPGGQRQQSKTFKKWEDADAYRRKVESNEMVGLVTDHRRGEELFGPYAAGWLDHRLIKGRPLSPATLNGYRGLMRRNITPHLDGSPLRSITPEVVRTWHAKVAKDAGQDQAAKSYRLLRAILNTAVDDELLFRNPCRIKGAGSEHADERPMLDTAMVLDLADAIEARYRALVLLSGLGGLRTGEMLGLTRADVDILHGTVNVARQAQEIPHEGRLLRAPKTDAGRRTVSLPPTVAKALEDHLAAYSQPGATGAVFTGPKGTPLRRATLSAAWVDACAAAGAPEGLRIHDCRHHAATTMARMPGVTTKELMARIGHSSPRAALIYQHATAERDRSVADYLEAQLGAVERTAKAPVQDLSCEARAIKPGTSKRKRTRKAV